MQAYALTIDRQANETYSITVNGTEITYTPKSKEAVVAGFGAKIREVIGAETYSVFEDDLNNRIVIAPERKKAKLEIATKDPKISLKTLPLSEPVNQKNIGDLLSDFSRSIQPFPALSNANIQPMDETDPPPVVIPSDVTNPPTNPSETTNQPTTTSTSSSSNTPPTNSSTNMSNSLRAERPINRGMFLSDGNFVPVIAPAAVTSGQPVKFGGIRGIAVSSGPAGQSVGIAINGVFTLKPSVAVALGDKVFWNGTALAKSGEHEVGIVLDSKEANQDVRVLLT